MIGSRIFVSDITNLSLFKHKNDKIIVSDTDKSIGIVLTIFKLLITPSL